MTRRAEQTPRDELDDLRQRIELAPDSFALLLHPGAQVLMAFAAARGDEDGNDATGGQSRVHFLTLAPFADLRCLATSSSSR